MKGALTLYILSKRMAQNTFFILELHITKLVQPTCYTNMFRFVKRVRYSKGNLPLLFLMRSYYIDLICLFRFVK